MTNEIAQADQYSTADIDTAYTSTNEMPAAWEWSQFNTTELLTNTKLFVKELYQNNRGILTTIGLVYVAFLGVRLLFAALNAIDDIPLVSPILKLVGLIYAASFAWNHLVKEHDRQELVETFNRTKAEILGSHSPENY